MSISLQNERGKSRQTLTATKCKSSNNFLSGSKLETIEKKTSLIISCYLTKSGYYKAMVVIIIITTTTTIKNTHTHTHRHLHTPGYTMPSQCLAGVKVSFCNSSIFLFI